MPIDSLFGDAGASLDWQYIISYAILLAPAVIPGVLFIYSFITISDHWFLADQHHSCGKK